MNSHGIILISRQERHMRKAAPFRQVGRFGYSKLAVVSRGQSVGMLPPTLWRGNPSTLVSTMQRTILLRIVLAAFTSTSILGNGRVNAPQFDAGGRSSQFFLPIATRRSCRSAV